MYGSGSNQPIIVLKEGTERSKDKEAQFNNIAAARTISDAVRSSLGPRGMDKMLVDSMGDVIITNDGVTILKEIDVQHPAAKMLVEVAKTQDTEVGDGTTTSVILAGELLKKSLDMVDSNVHPTVIASGYRLANAKAQEILEEIAEPVTIDNDALLMDIAGTAMNSKQINNSKEFFSRLVVDAVKTVAKEEDGKYTVDLNNIQTVKKTGASMDETELVKGLIIDKEPVHSAMPKVIKDAKIALIDAPFEIKKTEIDAKIEIKDTKYKAAFTIIDYEDGTFGIGFTDGKIHAEIEKQLKNKTSANISLNLNIFIEGNASTTANTTQKVTLTIVK